MYQLVCRVDPAIQRVLLATTISLEAAWLHWRMTSPVPNFHWMMFSAESQDRTYPFQSAMMARWLTRLPLWWIWVGARVCPASRCQTAAVPSSAAEAIYKPAASKLTTLTGAKWFHWAIFDKLDGRQSWTQPDRSPVAATAPSVGDMARYEIGLLTATGRFSS